MSSKLLLTSSYMLVLKLFIMSIYIYIFPEFPCFLYKHEKPKTTNLAGSVNEKFYLYSVFVSKLQSLVIITYNIITLVFPAYCYWLLFTKFILAASIWYL